MIRFLANRLLQAILVMLFIGLVCFVAQDSLGDPTREVAGYSANLSEREKIKQALGLTDPKLVQYGRFLKNLARGDLGTSYFFKESTIVVILKKFPATLELVFTASLIVVIFSVPLGVFSAIYPRHWTSKLIMAISVIGISIPVFLTALGLIYLFSNTLNWMPSFGRGDIVHVAGYWSSNFLSIDGFKHIIMPAFALSSVMIPLFIRFIRAEMIEVLSSEYVKFARAKGLGTFRVTLKHALKNTMIPIITLSGVQFGTMLAYTVLTETIFQWPGMGFMFLEAINRSDIPLITAYIMFVGFIFVMINTLVDLLYGMINPTVDLLGNRA